MMSHDRHEPASRQKEVCQETPDPHATLEKLLHFCKITRLCGKIEIPLRDGNPLEDHIMLKIKARKILGQIKESPPAQ